MVNCNTVWDLPVNICIQVDPNTQQKDVLFLFQFPTNVVKGQGH
jgi:hypothetical protein